MIHVDAVLLGLPAGGKGTASQWLRTDLGFHALCTGDIYRDIIEAGGVLSTIVRGYLDQGLYAPDSLTNELTRQFALYQISKGDTPILLDGYPRNVAQYDYFCNHYQPKLFIVMNASFEASKRAAESRRQCAHCKKIYNLVCSPLDQPCCDDPSPKMRSDDTGEMYEKRYMVYASETEPLVDKVLSHCSNVLSFNTLEGVNTREQLVTSVKSFLIGQSGSDST